MMTKSSVIEISINTHISRNRNYQVLYVIYQGIAVTMFSLYFAVNLNEQSEISEIKRESIPIACRVVTNESYSTKCAQG